MDYSCLMRRRESARHLNCHIQHNPQIHADARDVLSQRLSFDILRSHKLQAAVFPDLMNREDVRMIQGRSCACFLLKATQPVFIPGELAPQQFECDPSTQTTIMRQKHFAHTTVSKEAYDFVVADLFTCDYDAPVLHK